MRCDKPNPHTVLQTRYTRIRTFLTDVIADNHSTDSCDVWPWRVNNQGYPEVRYQGRMLSVTHLVLELTGNPRPDAPNDCALHACDTPRCCNPHHLRWGTKKQNTDDRRERGRTWAKLTAADVLTIRDLHSQGVKTVDLVSRFPIGPAQMNRILRRERWTHL